MSLYYDAASVLSSDAGQGSLKSRVYGLTNINSKPAQIFALISETTKRNLFLKEVIESAQLLENEPKLSPLLALLLCHDHLFARGGIAAAQKHALRQAVERHKGRLQSEFTRARLRRKCPSLDALKTLLDSEAKAQFRRHPRWVRVNTLRAQDTVHAARNIPRSEEKSTITEILDLNSDAIAYCRDANVPNLLAFSPDTNLTKSDAYKSGELILQDKASCFPARLLLGDQKAQDIGDIIDGCAAPGNKTTHLAAILQSLKPNSKIIACERDAVRSKTLQTMVAKAGADGLVQVLAKQDFLALDPTKPSFRDVTHLLLDPSCSGSGILGREDVPKLVLPVSSRSRAQPLGGTSGQNQNPKKRKRENGDDDVENKANGQTMAAPDEEEAPTQVSTDRLQKLSSLQTRIVEHAMSFPAARRITYSTCSIHEQENEVVISRLLLSEVAQKRCWKVLPRAQQVEGMRTWKHRGVNGGENVENRLKADQLDACIRCYPDDEEGTMGFFVCAFVREESKAVAGLQFSKRNDVQQNDSEDEDEWTGFD